MRRITWMVAIVLCVTLIVAGCGKKDEAGVVKDLEHVKEKMTSYKAVGSMLLHTGQEPLEYNVEVWFQDPHYYRIALTNVKKDITQIILRNDDGVFVLTPSLKKSFRFQSDWPDKQGQVYLYQTLIDSILEDKERQFVVDGKSKSYVFDVAAKYENSSLARQKIWLSQDKYIPEHVEISDGNANVMVVLEFDQFELGKEFEKKSFDMDHNLTSASLESLAVIGTIGEEDGKGAAAEGTVGEGKVDGEGTAAGVDGISTDEAKQDFGVIIPQYTPEGVELVEARDIMLGDEQAVMLRYEGLYNYTIVEEHPKSRTTSLIPGTLIDLQFTIAALTGDEHQMLRWTHEGVDYKLSTGDLTQSEMVKIAQSVQGQIGK